MGNLGSVVLGVGLLASGLSAQVLLQAGGSGRVLTFGGDAAILDAKDVRNDIPCTVTPRKPEMGFDLKYHAGYEVSIPMKELNGGEDMLTMIFRVTPGKHPDEPIYLAQRIAVPKLREDASGQASVEGGFDLGEGEYTIDWMMRDRAERVCSSYWTATATPLPKERGIPVSVPQNSVEAPDWEPFRPEPPVARDSSGGLNVKVLVNFAPQRSLAAMMQPFDLEALVSILRNISREPRIAKFSLVAFNMQEQRVVYRQDMADQIDFPALGESLNSLKLGTVHVNQLEQKHPEAEFLTQLLTAEMANDHPDAVIFAGPKVVIDNGVATDSVAAMGGSVNYPVFYMNYNLNPSANPWRDAIGNVVRKLRGYEYTISRPHELWNAWSEIMSRIVRLKMAKVSTQPAGTH